VVIQRGAVDRLTSDVAATRLIGPRTAAEHPAEPPAFEERLRALESDLAGFVVRRVRDRDLAGDVVQETMLRAYRARASFDKDRPLWPWLQTIASNLIANTMRDQRRHREHVQTSGWDGIASAADMRCEIDPESNYLAAQRRVAIATALASLSSRQRRVLLLRAADGLSYEDIAAVEGLSTDAVKSLLKRARHGFRYVYEAESGLDSLTA
jgi:RNA polymerase sigma-70 factor (ECF subfamily)